jgi:hypothetical protein
VFYFIAVRTFLNIENSRRLLVGVGVGKNISLRRVLGTLSGMMLQYGA